MGLCFKIAFLSAPFWGAFWQSLFFFLFAVLAFQRCCIAFVIARLLEIGGECLDLATGVHSLVEIDLL